MFTYILFIIVGIILFILFNNIQCFNISNQILVSRQFVENNLTDITFPEELNDYRERQISSGGPCSLYNIVQFFLILGVTLDYNMINSFQQLNNKRRRSYFLTYLGINLESFKAVLQTNNLSPFIHTYCDYTYSRLPDLYYTNTPITKTFFQPGQIYMSSIHYKYNDESINGHAFLLFTNGLQLFLIDACYRNFDPRDSDLPKEQRRVISNGANNFENPIDLRDDTQDSIAVQVVKFWTEKHYIKRDPTKYSGQDDQGRELSVFNFELVDKYSFKILEFQSPISQSGMYIGKFKIKVRSYGIFTTEVRKIFSIHDGYLELKDTFESDDVLRYHIYDSSTRTMCQYWNGNKNQEEVLDDSKDLNYVTIRDLNGDVIEVKSNHLIEVSSTDKDMNSLDNITFMFSALQYYADFMINKRDRHCSA